MRSVALTGITQGVAVESARTGAIAAKPYEDSFSTQPDPNTAIVIVNGKEQNAGKETRTTEKGKTTVTVKVEDDVIKGKIDDAVNNSTTSTDNMIQIRVSDTKSDAVKAELSGDIVSKLEENTFDVSIKRENVEYVIPAAEFNISFC